MKQIQKISITCDDKKLIACKLLMMVFVSSIPIQFLSAQPTKPNLTFRIQSLLSSDYTDNRFIENVISNNLNDHLSMQNVTFMNSLGINVIHNNFGVDLIRGTGSFGDATPLNEIKLTTENRTINVTYKLKSSERYEIRGLLGITKKILTVEARDKSNSALMYSVFLSDRQFYLANIGSDFLYKILKQPNTDNHLGYIGLRIQYSYPITSTSWSHANTGYLNSTYWGTFSIGALLGIGGIISK